MTDISVFIPFTPRRPEQALQWAGLVHWTDAARLWQGQTLLTETHQTTAALSGAGFRVPSGTGVSLMPLRHPYLAAVEARSAAIVTGHPFVAGFGPGSKALQRAVMGRPYRSALTASREYLTIVRGLLDGGTVDMHGEYFSCNVSLGPYPAPRIDVGLGVLRPGMARLAGEVADVAITWLTPANYVRDEIVPAVLAGAEAASRPRPRIVAVVPVAVDRDGRDPVEAAKAGSGAHLQGPHYLDMLRRSGAAVTGTDLDADARALVSSNAFLSGDVTKLRSLLDEYTAAGVDEVVLNTTGVVNTAGPTAALEDVTEILAETAHRA
ncbi:5,10-methylene tetrahydromethanopterin reductase [Rhodococcus sp. 14-2483-1-1]|uniref:LLM class flavin-dependent oxidoreductase n=1 Tax=Rhodococcus sp. 14-2483-1-1 TaxID=2023148 RepID=UPI000B9A9C05|nr:LLM class flavin-dependent oxidoreductase [Rhodococcus sp. 14-2483-1-1]OZF36881.1 5,10-methylene tetrahydromethanopterin reductase [Rhodococcus sp. 14-2483-1-1]